MRRSVSSVIAIVLAVAVAAPLPASAAGIAKYPSLKSQGLKTGKLTQNRAGIHGWYVTGKGERYFCRMKVSIAYMSKTTAALITTSGRLLTIDRRSYDTMRGGPNPNAANWSDLKAGRPRNQDVGRCEGAN